MDLNKKEIDLTWNAMHLKIYSPKTNASEQEVRKIVYNQYIANRLPDVFIETKQVTKSYIPAANVSGTN